jgi:hypothetical protein
MSPPFRDDGGAHASCQPSATEDSHDFVLFVATIGVCAPEQGREGLISASFELSLFKNYLLFFWSFCSYCFCLIPNVFWW